MHLLPIQNKCFKLVLSTASGQWNLAPVGMQIKRFSNVLLSKDTHFSLAIIYLLYFDTEMLALGKDLHASRNSEDTLSEPPHPKGRGFTLVLLNSLFSPDLITLISNI